MSATWHTNDERRVDVDLQQRIFAVSKLVATMVGSKETLALSVSLAHLPAYLHPLPYPGNGAGAIMPTELRSA